MLLKKLLLSALLGLGVICLNIGNQAAAADHSVIRTVKDVHSPSSEVRKAHSPSIRTVNGNQFLQWKVDLTIRDAEGLACTIEVELCNAAGKPHVRLDGTNMKFVTRVIPDSDAFRTSAVSFQMYLDDFWFFYGHESQDLTFKVTVREVKSGKVINTPAMMAVKGLAGALPPAPTDRTDTPIVRPKSVWFRLLVG